jgi:hypothetical protein
MEPRAGQVNVGEPGTGQVSAGEISHPVSLPETPTSAYGPAGG